MEFLVEARHLGLKDNYKSEEQKRLKEVAQADRSLPDHVRKEMRLWLLLFVSFYVKTLATFLVNFIIELVCE